MCSISSYGQLDVQLDINPNISPYLYEWEGTGANDILVTTHNPENNPFQVVYRVWLINGAGEEIANSDPSDTPEQLIEPGTTSLPLVEIFPISALNYNGDYEVEITQTGKLPEDNYTMCIEAFQPGSFQPLSQNACGFFQVMGYQDPFNIFPPDGQEVDMSTVQDMVFQWSSVTPIPQFGEIYRFSIYEVFPGQSPYEAVSVNPSIVEEEIFDQTQYITPLDFIPFEPNEGGYVWNVQAFSPEGLPYTEPNGQSQPTIFYVTTSTIEEECTCESCELIGLTMFVNGQESSAMQVPAYANVSFTPQYNVVCDPADCPTIISGQLTAEYSSQQYPNQTFSLESGEAFVLPGKGLLYLSWSGSASCDGAICECEGSYGPVQWQVSTGDDDQPIEGETVKDGEEPEGGGEGAVCECGPCSMSVPRLLHNGLPIDSKGTLIGVPLTLDVVVKASCNPASCPPIIDGYFKVGYTPNGGSWTEHVLTDNTTEFTIPEGVTILILNFEGTVYCDGKPCPCEGLINLEMIIPHQPNSEDPEDDFPDPENPRKPPGETVPPDSLKEKTCNAVAVSTNAASPIDLGMVLDEPETFPYPRAVPIRAEGIDWDYAVFQCDGCNDGVSEILYPVKDRMDTDGYHWKITSGLGSLNDPFSADSIKAAEKAIDKLLDEIDQLKKKVDQKNERLNNGIAADTARFNGMIKEAEAANKILVDKHKKVSDSLKTHTEEHKALTERFKSNKDSLSTARDSIKAIDLRILKLEKHLKNPESAEEIAALKIASEKAKEWKLARKAVTSYEKELITHTKAIEEQLASLKEAERAAADKYNRSGNEAFAIARQISDLEAALYHTVELRKYRKARIEWNSEYNKFYSSVLSGATLKSAWDTKKESIDDQTLTLAKTHPDDRIGQYATLHSEFLSFMPMPGAACLGASNPTACSQYATTLVEATLNYDTAMAKLNTSTSHLDPAIMAALETARNQLSSKKASLTGLEAKATQASLDYKAAAKQAIVDLRMLQKTKADKIAAMEAKAKEAGAAEKNYREKKDARMASFESKKLGWETSLLGEQASKSMHFTNRKAYTDSLSLISNLLDEVNKAIKNLGFTVDALDEEIKKYTDLLAKLKAKLAELNSEPAKINQELAALAKEIEALRKKVKKAEEHLSNVSQPGKSANGPLVYYVPPPMEEVFKVNGKLPEFEKQIAKVDSAKADYQLALNDKKSIQKYLVSTIDRVAWDMLSYKNSKTSIEELEARIKELEEDIAQKQGEVALEEVDEHASLDEKFREAKTKQKEAEDKAKKCKSSGSKERQKVADLIKRRDLAKTELDEAKEVLATAKSEDVYHQVLFRNSSHTLGIANTLVKEKKNEIIALEQQIGRLQNEQTINKASDADGEGDSESGLTELESKLESEQSMLEGLKGQVKSVETSQMANALALKKTTKTVYEKDSLMVISRDVYLALEDSLEAAYEQLKKGGNCSSYWESVAKEWERKAIKLKTAIDQKVKDTAIKVAENEGVVELTKQKDEAEALLKSLKKDKGESETSVKETMDEKAKRLKEVNQAVSDTKEALEKAEEALRQWLVKEFETITFEVELELVGDDEVVDKWRSGDSEAKLIKKLKYSGSRIPQLQNKYAAGGLPAPKTTAVCQIELQKKIGAMPDKLVPPTPIRPEPRTIALVYENGKPIWPEWPVIPQDEKRFLQKDVLLLKTYFWPDIDVLDYFCTSNMDCDTPPPIVEAIIDVGAYDWNLEGRQINDPKKDNWRYAIWETDEVEKPKKEEKQEVKSIFNGNLIAGDLPVEQSAKYNIIPGLLIEVPDTLFGVPDTTVELLGRVIGGDHKGLEAEEIEFEVKLIAGSSTGYGFEGDSLKSEDTDGLGYARLDFNFGDGFAKFEVDIRWKRGGQIIQSEKTILIAPISIDIHKVGPGPPEIAWQTAAQAVDNGTTDLESLTSGLPDCVYDGETTISDECKRQMRTVAGLMDYHYEFVNAQIINFEIDNSDITLNPTSDSTEFFGIGHTLLLNVKENVEAEMTASVEDKYLPLGRPGEAKAKMSSKLIEQFFIGDEKSPFLVLLDSPVPVGTTITGKGMLGVVTGGIGIGLMVPLQQVKLDISNIELEQKGKDEHVAIAGEVVWEGAVTANALSFEMTATKLGIKVGIGAVVEGNVTHQKSLPDPISFEGVLSPTGDFIAGISDLPEFEFKGLKLIKGASIILDMHANDGPTDQKGFKGVFIPNASLELPERFNDATTGVPTLLTAENFYIGNSGLGGTISLTGAFFEVGYKGYAFSGKSVSVTIEKNKLETFSLGAQMDLGSPFQGSLLTTIEYANDKFEAKILTETPIFIPQLKVVFSILPNSGIDKVNGVYGLQLNANIQSDHVGTMKVDKLLIKTNGDVSLDKFTLDNDINFGSGFQIQKPSLSFKIAKKESSFALSGKVILPKLDNTYVEGTIGVKPGPVFFVELTKASVEIDYGPVNMSGELAYSQAEFRGKLGVGFKNMSEGISGLIIFGNKPVANSTTMFSYWYGELSVPLAIPLGQTGVSILKLGGGLGYNFTPPMGDVDGFAVNSDAFSFKALMGFGNTPQGKMLAGEVQMSVTKDAVSLYGRLWALNKRESFFGEGQMTLVYASAPIELKGYMAMGIKLPDPEGAIMDFDGKINFSCISKKIKIKSDKIEGTVLDAIQGKGDIDIDDTRMYMGGKIWYDLNKSFDITSKERIEVVLNVEAKADLKYIYADQTMSSKIDFEGNWRVTLVNRLHDLNVTSGAVAVKANAYVSPKQMRLKASGEITWDFWVNSGSMNADFGYTKNI